MLGLYRLDVTFKWKDYRAKGRCRYGQMTLSVEEFMRRFLLHALPHGFHRIRHYGLLANASRVENLARAWAMLMAVIPALLVASLVVASDAVHDTEVDDVHHCPCCGAPMIVIETFERGQAPRAPPPPAGDLP